MTYPHHDDTAELSELARYLLEARRAMDAATPADCAQPARLGDDFDTLRWFELPEVCVTS